MQLAKSDRLGLVAFAGSAFLQCPLTIDDVAFRQSLDALDVNIIPQGGTAIAEAIETAQTAFKEGDNHRVLVLMTDGEDQDSGAVEAAKKAAATGLRIYTVGIGTPAGELLHIKDPQGRPDYIRDEQGNVVKSHLNERLLQEIAGATEGGFYLPLRGAKTMDALYEQGLAKLPKSEHQQKLVKRYEERYHWPLGLAIVLLVVEFLVPERKRQARPASASTTVLKGALQAASVMLLLPLLMSSGLASPSSALREYKAGPIRSGAKGV
jgi:Ca-activated chloride channel family protein